MRSNLQISCENWEAMVKEDAALNREQVFLQSEELYQLLVPESRERYEGVRLNFFGFVEWRHKLEDNIFFHLIEQAESLALPAKMIPYLEQLLELLRQDEGSFPLLYSMRDPDEGVPCPLLSRFELRDATIEAGYDRCIADVHGVWHDLRRLDYYDGEDSAGRKKHLLIVSQSIEEVFGQLFRQILAVARVAQDKQVRLCLTAQHHREDRVQPALKVENGTKIDSKSDEEQISMYMKMVDEIPIPTPGEEEDLVRKIEMFGEEGAASRRRLTQGYFRLVVSLATKYLERGVRLLDLIAQANHTMSRAVGQYDFASGVPFSNYATWRIESALQELVGEGGSSESMSGVVEQKLQQVKELSNKLKKDKRRAPSELELAEAMGIGIEELRRLFEQV